MSGRLIERNGRPQDGDLATTEHYGRVELVGKLEASYETVWVVRTWIEGKLELVMEDELSDVGYYFHD